jgi:hypothetical protein
MILTLSYAMPRAKIFTIYHITLVMFISQEFHLDFIHVLYDACYMLIKKSIRGNTGETCLL